MTLKCDVCGTTALSLQDSNNVTDPTQDRWELYECENGHTQVLHLEGRK